MSEIRESIERTTAYSTLLNSNLVISAYISRSDCDVYESTSYLHYWGWDEGVTVLFFLLVRFMCTFFCFFYPEQFQLFFSFFFPDSHLLYCTKGEGRAGHKNTLTLLSLPADDNGRLVWDSVLLFLLLIRRTNLTEFVILRVLWVRVEEGSQLGWVVGHDPCRSGFKGTAEIVFRVHNPEVGLGEKTWGRDSELWHFDYGLL